MYSNAHMHMRRTQWVGDWIVAKVEHEGDGMVARASREPTASRAGRRWQAPASKCPSCACSFAAVGTETTQNDVGSNSNCNPICRQ